MGGICKRLPVKCILLDCYDPAAEKDPIIRRLVEALAQVYEIQDTDQLVKDIMEREELASTCLGFGCALPHAHSPILKTTAIAAARLDPPLNFKAPDDEPVELVFLMVGPENSAVLHLKLLSKLVRLLHDAGFREELLKAETPEAFHQLICRKDE
ncbi:MAG: PTS sugar transporter subunit IIA [Spirochaetia bacterium]|nr:PTS sugar transporter subunit IIA [Spirochaetia bacterium]